MFYDKFKYLCDEEGISGNKAAADLGLSNATPTMWKKRGLTPKGETLSKIADYFRVPLDFVLGRPPFDYWDAINQDHKNFLNSLRVIPDVLWICWGIDVDKPDPASGREFISFLSACVDKALPKEDSGWIVVPRACSCRTSPDKPRCKPPYAGRPSASAPLL